MKPRALLAELFGTFGLTLAVFISFNNTGFPIPPPVIAGMTLGLFVYAIGPVSGCHINPAVTVGLWSVGRIGPQDAVGYLIAQFAGAALAMVVGGAFFVDPVTLDAGNTALIGFAELFGAILFLFAVTAVVVGIVPGNLSGIVIGSGYMLGWSWAAHASNGLLNPALALGVGSFSLAYVWGPVGGAVVGAQLANFLCRSDGG